jgi:hypothetical protein
MEVPLDACKDVGLEVSTEETKYVFIFRHHVRDFAWFFLVPPVKLEDSNSN